MNYNAVKTAKTNYYEISVNKSMNHANLILKGYWNESDEMQYYVEDIKAAVNMLKPDFTFTVDMTGFSGCISKYLTLTIEAQKYLVSIGLKVTAEILPPNQMLRQICEMLSKASGMETVYFNDRVDAEKWLFLNKNF